MEKKIKHTFKKHERLYKTKDIRRVLEQGDSIKGGFFVMCYTKSTKNIPRCGVIASKKVSRKAVDRNRAKRLLREAFRLNKHKLKPYDLVLIARKNILGAKCQEVEKELINLAIKANIINGEDIC